MASRRTDTAAARQARLDTQRAAAARAAQRKRIGLLGAIVIVGVIVAAVAIVISSGGAITSPGLASTPRQASATWRTVAAELKGIPQHGTTLGRADAPVTIEYFGDLECPYCALLTDGSDGAGLPQLISGPVRAGQVKLVYRSVETATALANDDRWLPQQTAAYAAGDQDLFWDYAELFYHEQGEESDHYVTPAYLAGLARQIPALNLTRWQRDRRDAALTRQVDADGREAVADGLGGTPSLVASGVKGAEIVASNGAGVQSYAAMRTAIAAVS